MDPLAVVVGVLAVVLAANLLLTAAVIRRLAAHERKLATLGPLLQPPGGLTPGTPLPEFAAATVDGRDIDREFLGDGGSVMGFFSTGCDACRDHAPEFVALAAGTRAVAVVVGDGDEPLLRALGAVPVVREHVFGGALVGAFEVDAYPTYFAIDRGEVIAQAASVKELAAARRS